MHLTPDQENAGSLLALVLEYDPELRTVAEERYLEHRRVVVHAGRPPARVYFPLNCVCSVLVRTSDGQATEVGAVGREGCAGIEALFDAPAPADIVIQIAGSAVSIPAPALRASWNRHLAVRSLLDRYIVAKVSQFMQTGACNRLHSVEQRAARWILRMADAAHRDQFEITHEFLAAMLGANRTTITLVLGGLRDAGAIDYRRSEITVIDREALHARACECYDVIRDRYQALLPEESLPADG